MSPMKDVIGMSQRESKLGVWERPRVKAKKSFGR
jgi:hypothetical protein